MKKFLTQESHAKKADGCKISWKIGMFNTCICQGRDSPLLKLYYLSFLLAIFQWKTMIVEQCESQPANISKWFNFTSRKSWTILLWKILSCHFFTVLSHPLNWSFTHPSIHLIGFWFWFSKHRTVFFFFFFFFFYF